MFSKQSKIDINIIARLNQELGFFLKNYDITIDSRKANAATIFCAYPGTVVDGRDFILSAIKNGCNVILYEEINSKISADIMQNKDITLIKIANLQLYVGYIAALKHGNIANQSYNIAVTGTNGKTSISYWLNQVYTKLQKKAGLIGTLGAGIYPNIVYNNMTTPDPITLQDTFSNFANKNVDMVVMETSSHAIHQGRINGIEFKSAIFTNLTQDHLDYHLTMENYYQAKKDLFYWQNLENAIINVDDKYGMRLYEELSGVVSNKNLQIMTYGINHGDVRASNVRVAISGTKFDLSYNNETISIIVGIIGKFNVYNILAITCQLIIDGYNLSRIKEILTSITPVNGRMDAIINKNKPLIVVDFSHTPDSLENAILTLKEIEHRGKLYCVFGCGGNRDKLKRPIMGEIASRLADVVIVTSDNPRFEEPNEIIDNIVVGIKDQKYIRIEDRHEAIKYAIENASSNDIVLIAGKGHEDYQEIEGIKHHFSDLLIAHDLIQNKKG